MRRPAFAVAACLAFGHTGLATAQETDVNADVRAAARQVFAGEQHAGLRQLETLAQAGDIDPHNMLGELYAGFGGVERDRPKSCRHFLLAREARLSVAHGLGGPIDLAAAGQWMEKAYGAGRRDAAALAG